MNWKVAVVTFLILLLFGASIAAKLYRKYLEHNIAVAVKAYQVTQETGYTLPIDKYPQCRLLSPDYEVVPMPGIKRRIETGWRIVTMAPEDPSGVIMYYYASPNTFRDVPFESLRKAHGMKGSFVVRDGDDNFLMWLPDERLISVLTDGDWASVKARIAEGAMFYDGRSYAETKADWIAPSLQPKQQGSVVVDSSPYRSFEGGQFMSAAGNEGVVYFKKPFGRTPQVSIVRDSGAACETTAITDVAPTHFRWRNSATNGQMNVLYQSYSGNVGYRAEIE